MALPDRDSALFYRRGAVIILCSTVTLTAAFVGLFAFASGRTTGFRARVPWYVLVSAALFTAVILLLERQESSGRTIIVTALAVDAIGTIVASLAIEGVLYAAANPREVFVSQLVLYFLAAALFGTGLAYWGVRHWREFS